jgi:hypothetical protein
LCAWCVAEGKPGYLGEREPFADPAETHGICWRHRLESLGAVLKEGLPDADSSIGFVIVVARNRPDLFEQISEEWLSVPRVRVVLDRRRGDRRTRGTEVYADRRHGDRRASSSLIDDALHQPVTVLPVKRAAVTVTVRTKEAPALVPASSASSGEPQVERLRHWIAGSRVITQGTVPSMLFDWERWSARAREAEARLQVLRGEREDMALTLAGLRGRNNSLTRQQAEMAEALAAALRHMKIAMGLV